ncbi:hypothetical protein D3C78_1716730 [compost metagenome]
MFSDKRCRDHRPHPEYAGQVHSQGRLPRCLVHTLIQRTQLRIKNAQNLELQTDDLQQRLADFGVEPFGSASQEPLKPLVALAGHATALGQQATNLVGELNALLDQ